MTKQPVIEFKNDDIQLVIDEHLAVIKILSKNPWRNLFTDLEKTKEINQLYTRIENDNAIKGLLFLNNPDCFGETAYINFLAEISGKNIDSRQFRKISDFEHEVDRMREILVTQQYILRMVHFRKLTFNGSLGNVSTPFLGAGLSLDFRFASEGGSFTFPHIKYGLHPTGALPFWLPHYVNKSKSDEILFTGKDLSVEEALGLRLIHAIFPVEDFHNRCISEAKTISDISQSAVKSTKELRHDYGKDLIKYFETERRFVGIL
ncbi:enoyl-CoA hydratase/isomerase family protein [Bacteroidota bacterium]